MKYFTKEWYRAALAEEQQRAAGGKLKFNKKPDNAMRDYQRALSKIQSKLPACVCKTFHGSVITDVAVRQDQVVLYFDNSESFSDVESLPPQGSAYIVLMLMVPKDWKQLKVTYVPTFLEGKSLTFVMNASDVIRS